MARDGGHEEEKKTGQNRNPKKKGAERRNWDDLLVVWCWGFVFLVVSGVSGWVGVGSGSGWLGRQGTGVFGS
jgi:hypothetical protein